MKKSRINNALFIAAQIVSTHGKSDAAIEILNILVGDNPDNANMICLRANVRELKIFNERFSRAEMLRADADYRKAIELGKNINDVIDYASFLVSCKRNCDAKNLISYLMKENLTPEQLRDLNQSVNEMAWASENS